VTHEFVVVGVGGTFDRLHAGHRKLLETAFEVGEQVLIGLASDELVQSSKKPHGVGSYADRERELAGFLRERGLLARAEVVPLYDSYGLATTDPSIEALVVTAETAPGVAEINSIRASRGLRSIRPVMVADVLAEDLKPISSTRIRAGEIDTKGRTLLARSARRPRRKEG